MKIEYLEKAFELNEKIKNLRKQIEKAKNKLSEKYDGFKVNIYSIEESMYDGDEYKSLIFDGITREELLMVVESREKKLEALEKALEGIL